MYTCEHSMYTFLRNIRLLWAGLPGFEPGHAAVKVLCLTAWRKPNIYDLISHGARQIYDESLIHSEARLPCMQFHMRPYVFLCSPYTFYGLPCAVKNQVSADSGTWTHTGVSPEDFESTSSAIPTYPQKLQSASLFPGRNKMGWLCMHILIRR